MEGFLDRSGLLRTVLDALPLSVFVLDRDFRLLDRNAAAATFLESVGAGSVRRLSGDELHCLNGLVAAGCGTAPACPRCVLRRAVTESAAGAPRRQSWKLERLDENGVHKLNLRVTAVDVSGADEPLTMLIVEDVSELTALRELVPVCACCKKIRNDSDYWEQMESYLARHLDMKFTHGICPDCLEKYYPQARPAASG